MNNKYANHYLIKPDDEGNRADTKLAMEFSDEEIESLKQQGYVVVNEEDFQKLIGNDNGKEYLIAKDGTISEKPPYVPPLEVLKTAKLQEVDSWTARKITGGFVSTCYNGESVLYDTDTDTQLTMTKARANCGGERFALAFPNGMGVRGYAQIDTDEKGNPVFSEIKSVFLFSPENIIAWDEDFSLYLAQCKYEGWVKQAEVNACTTVEEVESIVLEV